MAQEPPVGQGLLIIEDSWSHSDTPHSVGLLWTSDQPVTETFIWQHTTLIKKHLHVCHRRDSNPQSQQAICHRPTPWTARPLGSANCILKVLTEKKPDKMQQCKILLSLILNKVQHVSGDTPPIVRSLKLHKQPLVLHTWKGVQPPSTYANPEAACAVLGSWW
jgi:hypothetical protein